MKPVITTINVGDADARKCTRCGTGLTFWVSREVGLYSASGYRTIRILLCENHPTPTAITERADGEYEYTYEESSPNE